MSLLHIIQILVWCLTLTRFYKNIQYKHINIAWSWTTTVGYFVIQLHLKDIKTVNYYRNTRRTIFCLVYVSSREDIKHICLQHIIPSWLHVTLCPVFVLWMFMLPPFVCVFVIPSIAENHCLFISVWPMKINIPRC